MSGLRAFIAASGFTEELKKELEGHIQTQYEDLFICKDTLDCTPVWIQCELFNPLIINIESISDAAKKLKKLAPFWANHPLKQHRRAQLIQEQLPKFSIKPIHFLEEPPTKKISAWALLDNNTILASAEISNPYALGKIVFNENKEIPPSRAYLKLWELFTVYNIKPQAGEKCLDFGSSPGGWTWVLQTLGVQVLSVDRAPLAEHIAKLKNIEFQKRNAFTLKPQDVGPIDWFFSDIICYPPDLLTLVKEWMESELCKNFVCTIKYQGETDFKTTKEFQKIPGSKVIHLCHNKHEVTWVKIEMKSEVKIQKPQTQKKDI